MSDETPHVLTDTDRETAEYVDNCSTDVLEAIRKAMIERIKRYALTDAASSEITDEIMMHCVVDQVTIGIADAAQFQPQTDR